MIQTHRPEPLEARIAPATFLVSAGTLVNGDALNVTDEAGADAENLPNETTAAANAGADTALLLATNDKLVFDSNRNGKIDGTDALLVQVESGSAMVFLTDFDDNLVFSKTEISGLAVSDGFGGQIKTDVNGTIGTFLTASNEVLLTTGRFNLQGGSISSLRVEGAIHGDLIAGGNISDIQIGSLSPVELMSLAWSEFSRARRRTICPFNLVIRIARSPTSR
jgi:hypothetical protein